MKMHEKDKYLENRFDEYADGVRDGYQTTSAAKRYLEKKQSSKKTFKRSIFSLGAVVACVAIVFSVLLFNGFFVRNGSSELPSHDEGGINKPTSHNYSLDDLNAQAVNAYSENLPTGMEFLSDIAYARNASLADCTLYSDSDTDYFSRTVFSASVGGVRHDVEICVEYTGRVCAGYDEYSVGRTYRYSGTEYVTREEEVRGEYARTVYFLKDGKKYYITVVSSDENAYFNYLNLILAKN